MPGSFSVREDPPPPRRRLHEPFSESRPIPQVEAYFTDLSKPIKQPSENEDAYKTSSWFGKEPEPEVRGPEQVNPQNSRSGQADDDDDDNQEEHWGAQNKQQRQKTRKRDLHRGSSRVVQDPITLQQIKITNTDASYDDAMDPEKSRGRSVLQRDFPPMEWDAIAGEIRAEMATHALAAVVPTFILPYLFSFLFSLIILSFWWFVIYYHYDKVTQGIFENYKFDAERKRGQATLREAQNGEGDMDADKIMGRSKGIAKAGGDECGMQPHRESVEWVNQLLANLWPIIDPACEQAARDQRQMTDQSFSIHVSYGYAGRRHASLNA